MGSRFALHKGYELHLYCGCQPAAPSAIRFRKCQTLQKSSPDDSLASETHDRDIYIWYIWLHAHHWLKTHTRARTIEATSEALPNK